MTEVLEVGSRNAEGRGQEDEKVGRWEGEKVRRWEGEKMRR
jgi:hypothetical protein